MLLYAVPWPPQGIYAKQELNSAADLQNGLSALDRVLDLLEEPREMTAPAMPALVDRSRIAGRIALEDVSFRYGGDHGEGGDGGSGEAGDREIPRLVFSAGQTSQRRDRQGAVDGLFTGCTVRFLPVAARSLQDDFRRRTSRGRVTWRWT